MGMQVNTNLAANNAYRNLNTTQNQLSKSMEKLSSGMRINRAADDAAGLAISEGLKSQVGGLTVAGRNAQDGINVVQTAEGGLSQAQALLQRLRDLAVQAGNDSNNKDSRDAITTEATSLTEELGRISDSTNFGGKNLLDGTAGKMNFQVGANGDAASQISVDLTGSSIKAVVSELSLGTTGNSGTSFAIASPATLGGDVTFTAKNATGVTTSVTTSTIKAAGSYSSVQGYADDLNKDAGFSAKFTATVEKDANGMGTGVLVTAKDGSTLAAADNTAAQVGGAGLADGAAGAATKGLDFSTAAGAQGSIRLLETQITNVSTARATLGATQNRLESAMQTINISKENLSAAASRITDVDMASEMVSFTRSNILSQAGTAMLAQANQSNQGVLKLLG
jgi:flagellin